MVATPHFGDNESAAGGTRATTMGSISNNGEDAATSQRLIELVDLDRIRRINKKQKSILIIITRKEMCVLREKWRV